MWVRGWVRACMCVSLPPTHTHPHHLAFVTVQTATRGACGAPLYRLAFPVLLPAAGRKRDCGVPGLVPPAQTFHIPGSKPMRPLGCMRYLLRRISKSLHRTTVR